MRVFWRWLLHIDSPEDDVRRRGSMLALLAVSLTCFAVVTMPLALVSPQPVAAIITELVGVLCYSMVLYMARRGWVTAGGLLFIGVMVVGILAPMIGASGSSTSGIFLVLPVVVAGLILRPAQIWLVLAIVLVGLGAIIAANPLLQSAASLTSIASVVALLGIVGLLSFFGARAITKALADSRLARLSAERAADHLAQVNGELEQRVDERTHALKTALASVEEREVRLLALLAQNEQQANTIRDMSVPVIPISDTMLIMPLIGALDSARLQLIQQQALHAIQARRSGLLILDITGDPIIDTQVAQGLLMVTQATRLLGTEVVLGGVRPEVAQTIVGLGITLEGLRTASDLQSLLQHMAV
jgi:rsbT co-antagonist protein RsbR